MPYLLTILLLSLLPHEPPALKKLAVLPLKWDETQAVERLNAGQVQLLDDLIHGESEALPREHYRVIDSVTLHELLSPEDMDQLVCDGGICLRTLGRSAGADYTLGGDVIVDGSNLTISLKLVENADEGVQKTRIVNGLAFEELRQKLPSEVRQLLATLPQTGLAVQYLSATDDVLGSVTSFKLTDEQLGANIVNPVVDDMGFVFVECEPADSRIIVNGKEKTTTSPYQEELPVGRYIVVCEKGDLYFPKRKEITLTQEGAKFKLKLDNNFNDLRVESTPGGADIYLNGEPTGQKTPYSFPRKKSGVYKVSLVLPLHRSVLVEANVAPTKAGLVNATLQADFGVLEVTSEPRDAEVWIDGEPVGGRTPWTSPRKKAGHYRVAVVRDLHRPFEVDVELGAGKTEIVRAQLLPQYGVLDVRSDPPGAAIEINGEPTGQVTPFVFPPKKSGAYKVRVIKDRYLTETRDGDLGDGKATIVDVKLTQNFGSVVVQSDPPDLLVLLDLEDTGQRTPTTLETVAVGQHRIGVRDARYAVRPEKITVERGQIVVVPLLKAEKRLGQLRVLAQVVDQGRSTPVSNAEVRVDGQLVGTTPYKHEFLVGTYQVEVATPEAKPYSTSVRVDEGESILVDAKMSKYLSAEVYDIRKAEADGRRAVYHWTGGSLIAGGAVAAGIGTYFLVGRLPKNLSSRNDAYDAWRRADNLDDANYEAQAIRDWDARAKNAYLAGCICVGAGAALAAAGTVVVLLRPPLPETPSTDGSTPEVSVGPLLLPGGGGLGISGAW